MGQDWAEPGADRDRAWHGSYLLSSLWKILLYTTEVVGWPTEQSTVHIFLLLAGYICGFMQFIFSVLSIVFLEND